jgi:hypothetical protein
MAELVSESLEKFHDWTYVGDGRHAHVSTSGWSRHRRHLFFSTSMDGNKEQRLHTTHGSNSSILSLLKAMSISLSLTHTHSLSLMMMMNGVWSRTFKLHKFSLVVQRLVCIAKKITTELITFMCGFSSDGMSKDESGSIGKVYQFVQHLLKG